MPVWHLAPLLVYKDMNYILSYSSNSSKAKRLNTLS